MIRRGTRPEREGPQPPQSLREALLRDRPLPAGRNLPPAPDRPLRDPYAAYDPGTRIGLTALLTIVCGGALAATLVLASLWQATTPSLALPAQTRGLATLSEVDGLIALRAPDLQRQLDEGTDTLTLANFPVPVIAIDRSEAESADGTFDPVAYREALLQAGARQIYDHGLEALRASDAPTPASDRLIDLFLGGLTRERHDQATLALGPAAGVALVLTLLLLLAARGHRWLVLGLALAAGGAFALIFTLVARGALALLDAPPGTALGEYAAVTRTLLDLPLWNALAALGLGLTLTLPGLRGRRG